MTSKTNLLLGYPGSGKSLHIQRNLIPAALRDPSVNLLVITDIHFRRGIDEHKVHYQQPGVFEDRDIHWLTLDMDHPGDVKPLVSGKLNVIVLGFDPILHREPWPDETLRIMEEILFFDLNIDTFIGDEYPYFTNYLNASFLERVPNKYLAIQSIEQIIHNCDPLTADFILNTSETLYFDHPHSQPRPVNLEFAATYNCTKQYICEMASNKGIRLLI